MSLWCALSNAHFTFDLMCGICAVFFFCFVTQTCTACHKSRDEKKFSGRHNVCVDCRLRIQFDAANDTVEREEENSLTLFGRDPHSHSRLSLYDRVAIVALHKIELSDQQIAQRVGCDLRSVHHWISVFDQQGDVEDAPREGRPRLTTEIDDDNIEMFAREIPLTTPRNIRRELGLNVSSRTVRRRLDERQLFGRVARVEYPFQQKHLDARIAFARDHLTWSDVDWDQVVFSDESYIHLGQHGQIWVQRPEDAAFLEPYLAHRDPWAKKIGMWAAFHSKGVIAMRLFEGTMDSRFLCSTIEAELLAKVRVLYPNGTWVLLQDGATYHWSNETTSFLHKKSVSPMSIPSLSPDLNPIENLWAILKGRVEESNPPNLSELQEVAENEWQNIEDEICLNLVRSMPTRLNDLLNNAGHMTKY
jgi:transposase